MEQFQNKEIMYDQAVSVLFSLKDDLSITARLLYVALMQVDRDKLVKHDELKEITGFARGTVIKAIDELKEKNMILVSRTKYGAFYTLLSGDDSQ